MLNSSTWTYLNVCKKSDEYQIELLTFLWQYLNTFNYVQTNDLKQLA